LFTPGGLSQKSFACLEYEGVPPAEIGNAENLRRSELPSSNGITNCGSLAALASFLADCCNDIQPIPIFLNPKKTVEQLLVTAESYDVDKIMQTPVAFTQGGLAKFVQTVGEEGNQREVVGFGWGGAGGQMLRFFPELRLSVGYCTSKTGFKMAMNDPRPLFLLDSALNSLA